MHVGAFIRLLNNQSHSIDIFQIFHHAGVEMFENLSYNLCLDIQMNVFSTVSEHKRLTMLVVYTLIDIVACCYSLRSYQTIPYLASYGQPSALCTEFLFSDIFAASSYGM